MAQILQKQYSLFPQLIPRIFDGDEWDDKFYTIVAKFEALKKGIKYLGTKKVRRISVINSPELVKAP
ncbi:hypothetical protein NIES4071_91200 [Calothrix sp. NIES-4071]|nr:hypothetical protein NIES4071_91200 [Calothrix sp. NIES-4071]BAZ63387.1 hypothetical protein NIES4105_91130 [Calothrix sp. NIES-4105]